MAKQRLAMVIDLHSCVGCAACDIACKSENNVPSGFSWANHIIETSGIFPNVRYRHIPVLCNHCEDAPCITVCPTSSMHKDERGLTLHDADDCIGCRACQLACPYGAIYFNDQKPHAMYADTKPLLEGITASGQEMASKSGAPFPHYNEARSKTYDGIRRVGIVEKCTLCDHRLNEGNQPWCVETCPAKARVVGDLNDPSDPINRLLGKYAPRVLKKEAGTKPKVFYIRDY